MAFQKSLHSENRRFLLLFGCILGSYAGLVFLLIAADVLYMLQSIWEDMGGETTFLRLLVENPLVESLQKEEIRYAIKLTLLSCTLTAILSVLVAVPSGYILARKHFPFRGILDSLIDIPIVLPPLVVGLSLLILFQFWPFTETIPGTGKALNELVVYQIPAVILSQFAVAAAFAIRTMKVAFEQLSPRYEDVALTLGCSRWEAFARVVLPDVTRAMVAAGSIAWARALGEFGPLLIFAGATRRKTEVLSTTVFLELSIGNLEAAVAVSLYMVGAAFLILAVLRSWGERLY